MAARKVLIVFYSESGHTRQIADELAAALGATVERIHAPHLPRGMGGFLTRMWHSFFGTSARITQPANDPAIFDLVLIGSPVWGGRITSPARAWLRRFRGRINSVAAFVSCSKSGAESALAEVERLTGKRVLAHLSVCDEDRVSGRDVGKIQDFTSAVEQGAGLQALAAAHP